MREDILKQRYYWKDNDGNIIEDWDRLCRRVAKTVARKTTEVDEFYHVMQSVLFLPNSPALTNAGREEFSMSACFVLPVEDSIEGIFDAAKNAALVHKMGGGTGFSFSRLRPEGEMVGTTKGVASGPCSFIRIFNTGTEIMKQGGTRRGANMAMLHVDHPDILKFIAMKTMDGEFSNFNISVAVTDEFMEAVRNNTDYALRFNGNTRKTVKARLIWDKIIDCAWENGEPGVFFIDRANKANPTRHIGYYEGTNPCGEQPLLPYEACVLGSVNLAVMVKNKEIDWHLLGETVKTGVRMLDSIIDKQSYPLPEIEKMHKGNRKIGLGVMGWADMLIKLGINYASDEAVSLAEKIMSYITTQGETASIELAEEYGVFPNWPGSTWEEKGMRMRNATVTTIAPTGTLSIMANVNGGIEPVFAFETTQKRADQTFSVYHPIYEEWKKKNGEDAPLPPYFVVANDIPAEWHVKMQAAFQRHTHNAISKTINFPKEATKKDVENAYLMAYDLGCKGITVYRDGSRKNQVIRTKTTENKNPGNTGEPIMIPKIKPQKGLEVDTSEGTVYVSVTVLKEKPYEVFVTTPVESNHAEVYEALARIFSISLRCGVPAKLLLKQIEDANKKYGSVVSPTYAILRAFRMLGMNGGENEECPECGSSPMVLQEGCQKCPACGYSKC